MHDTSVGAARLFSIMILELDEVVVQPLRIRVGHRHAKVIQQQVGQLRRAVEVQVAVGGKI